MLDLLSLTKHDTQVEHEMFRVGGMKPKQFDRLCARGLSNTAHSHNSSIT